VIDVLSEVDGIDMSFNEDESVTLRWEPMEGEERQTEVADPFEAEEPAPF
jgi:hypothetical protein